ncbi:MAG: methyltransferase domain-containing protein [bacterium]
MPEDAAAGDSAAVEQYYDEGAEREWARLDKDYYHRLEYRTTLHFLRDYLPPAPAHILDCGGGPGRYAVALAQEGYRVTLLDLSEKCLAFAKEKAAELGVSGIEAFVHASATSLPFPDEQFDAVLLAGPLYHLVSEEDRLAAMRESLRVLKPGGLVAAAIVPLLGVFRAALAEFPEFIASGDCLRFLRRPFQEAGRDDTGLFTTAYFGDPLELEAQYEVLGAEVIALVALEGLASSLNGGMNRLAEEGSGETWWQIHLDTCTHPAIVGSCEHTLYLGRKRQDTEESGT